MRLQADWDGRESCLLPGTIPPPPNSVIKFRPADEKTKTAMPVFSTEHRFYKWRSEYLISLTQVAQPDGSVGVIKFNPMVLIPAGVLMLRASVACSTSTAPTRGPQNTKERQ